MNRRYGDGYSRNVGLRSSHMGRHSPLASSGTDSQELLRLFGDANKSERLRGKAGYRLSAPEVFEQLPSRDRRTAARLALEAFWEDKPHLAWGAAHLVYAAQPRSAWKRLSAAAASSLSADTRVNAIYALGMLGQRRAAPSLAIILQDARQPNPVRAMAAEALGLCARGSSRAVASLLGRLRDPSPEVRLFAANALAICGEKSEIPALKRLLKDQAAVAPYGSLANEAIYAVAAIRARAKKR